ncbi:hypothetical protein VPH5P1C_0253 [Vibrio phage 5P1c]|nr:hypothetical protein VP495E541_P0259 [Vibrio phage 495E54-1]
MTEPKITFTHEQLYFTKDGLPLFVPKDQLHKINRKGKLKACAKTIDLVQTAKITGITLSNITIEALINALNEVTE